MAMTTRRLSIIIYLVGSVLLLGACGTAQSVATTPIAFTPIAPARPIDTALPPAPPWRVASQPITTDNAPQLGLLGRLSAPGTPSTIFAHALSPDSTRLATLDQSYLVNWELVTGEPLFSITRRDEAQVYYAPDKTELYTVAQSGALYVFDAETGEQRTALSAPAEFNNVMTYQPTAGLLALGATTGDVSIVDVLARATVTVAAGEAVGVLALAFSPDGERLAVTYTNGTIRVWDWRAGMVVAQPRIPPAERRLQFDQLRFSNDGTILVGVETNVGAGWDAVAGNLLYTLPIDEGGGAYGVKIAPTGNYVLTLGLPKDARLWALASGAQAATFPDYGGIEPIDAAFSPDGTMLFMAQYGGANTLWNIAQVAQGSIFRGTTSINSKTIINTAWTDDGFLLLLFDARGPVEVWGIPE
ncbi:MAG: hypothetical protein H7Y11_01140 [Armatimonadetes bacterium]|nr:hypothetical protein [Anaerolineae bacterium]